MEAEKLVTSPEVVIQEKLKNKQEYYKDRTIDLKFTSKFIGANSHDKTGFFLSSALDINGDGFDDVLIGAPFASPFDRYKAGVSYVILGNKDHNFSIDLAKLNSKQGFKIFGEYDTGKSGRALGSLGDFNNDGYADFIIGAPNASPFDRTFAGEVYIIYGNNQDHYLNIDLANLEKNIGFKVFGETENSYTGIMVGSAGDFNNDNCQDIIITAPLASPLRRTEAGKSYIIFGNCGHMTMANIDLRKVNSYQGFEILGAKAADISGASVSKLQDFNGDGINDLVIGASWASPFNRSHAGEVYVLFGNKNISINIDLNEDIQYGFKIHGSLPNSQTGAAVSYAGDFNGDGLSDIIIGGYYGSPFGRTEAGIVYVIYGFISSDYENIDLAQDLTGKGFKIFGSGKGDQTGFSVSYAGDWNNDGLDDIVIGAYFASPSRDRMKAGISYLIYGQKGKNIKDIDLQNLKKNEGFKIIGAEADDNSGYAVANVGDFNKDGRPDIIIGSWESCPENRKFSGKIDIIFSGISHSDDITPYKNQHDQSVSDFKDEL